MANMPFFRVLYRAAAVRPQAAGNDLPPSSGLAPHSAAAADVLQPRIHPHVFRAPPAQWNRPQNAGPPKRNAIL